MESVEGTPTRSLERYKRNVARMKSGDLAEIGLVVAELLDRRRGKGLSAGEARMLRRAVEIVWLELNGGGGGEGGVREPRLPRPAGPSVPTLATWS